MNGHAMTRGKRRRKRSAILPRAASSSSHAYPGATGTVLLTFVVVFAALRVISYTQKSAAWDEPIHLTAGYAALVEHDYRVDPSHPPFLRMWAALPLLVIDRPTIDMSPIDRTAVLDWITGSKAYDFARQFIYMERDADRLLYASRFMVVVLGIVLGILLFCWAQEWLGFFPAVCALVFYTLTPTLATDASLVTTDFGVTCFMFGAVYFLWRTCRQLTTLNLAGLSAFFVLALISKFSGLLLGPIVVLLLAIAARQRSAITMRTAFGVVVLLAGASATAIWTAYGFRYAPSSSQSWLLELQNTPLGQSVPELTGIASWIDSYRLLPNAFTQGFLFSQATALELPAFLAGSYSDDGWWYYFPVAFLIKTPSPLIALLVLGLVVYVKRRRQLGIGNEAFVVLPIVIYLASAMTSHINIGVRHILPIYPFVLLIAAAAAGAMVHARRRSLGRIALGALAVYWLARFGAVYPDEPTFFNQFVGGPSNGYKYLSDSNLGWGQYLKPLQRWMSYNGVSHINLAYFGSVDPAYYGMNVTHLPGAPSFALDAISRPKLPGYVAISSTVLNGVYLDPRWRLFYRPFRDLVPAAVIGHSIRIYWVEQWPDAVEPSAQKMTVNGAEAEAHGTLADALFFGMQWPERALPHYRKYLELRPSDAVRHGNFGLALVASGVTRDAIQPFRRAVDLDPANGEARWRLAVALLSARNVEEAAVHARQAVAFLPRVPAVHDLLGRVLAVQGRLDEAAILFERALRLDPTYVEAREHLRQLGEATLR
jgi:tetratricopeptide (TPR) repeat protein